MSTASVQFIGTALAVGRPVVKVPLRLVRASAVWRPRNGAAQDVSDIMPSMAEHGLIHPIVVRTVRYEVPDPEIGPVTYEIVVGERRVQSATLLRWQEIEAILRDDLSDLDVFLIRIEENDRRKPLSPVEQADAVAQLMMPKADGGFGITDTAELATRLNISVQTVYQRIALAHTTPKVRAAIADAKLYLGSAIAIASITDPTAQDEALALALEQMNLDAEDPAPVRRVQHLVESRFHLRLARGAVPFDPTIAGLADSASIACGDCPKRTGTPAQRSLFSEPHTADVTLEEKCTDRACYRAKTVAWRDKAVAEAKAAGLKVAEGHEGHALYPAGIFMAGRAPGLFDLDIKAPGCGGQTYRELVGDAVSHEAVAVDANDRVHFLADAAKIRAALDQKGIKVEPEAAASTSEDKRKDKAKGKAPPPEAGAPITKSDEDFALARQAEEQAGLEALEACAEAAERRQMNARVYRFILRGVIVLASSRLGPVVERRELRERGDKSPDAALLMAALDKATEGELRGLLVEIIAAMDGLHPKAGETEHALLIASRFYELALPTMTAAQLKRLKGEAKTKGNGKAPKKKEEPPAPPVPASKAKKGTCSACTCTDRKACIDHSHPDGYCVWADAEETLCSLCAAIQASAVDAIANGEKSHTAEELAAFLYNAMEDDQEGTVTKERIAGCIADAVVRKKLVADAQGRFRRSVRVVEKPANSGATPLGGPPPVRSRIVAYLRGCEGKQSTRKATIDALAKSAIPTSASEVLREIAGMVKDGLLQPCSDPKNPIVLVARSYEEIDQELEALKPAELRARFADVMRTAAPAGMPLVDIRRQIAIRLSGETSTVVSTNVPKKDAAIQSETVHVGTERGGEIRVPAHKLKKLLKHSSPARTP